MIYVADYLDYDVLTGKLYWKVRTESMFNCSNRLNFDACKAWNNRHAGKEAITSLSNGYKQGNFLGKRVFAHRLIWKIVYEYDPDQVDHIDGNRSNNILLNLREVSSLGNPRNKAISKYNCSGVTGVYWYEPNKKWHAQISVNGKNKHLGSFDNLFDAEKARHIAEEIYGFHPNHGKRY